MLGGGAWGGGGGGGGGAGGGFFAVTLKLSTKCYSMYICMATPASPSLCHTTILSPFAK